MSSLTNRARTARSSPASSHTCGARVHVCDARADEGDDPDEALVWRARRRRPARQLRRRRVWQPRASTGRPGVPGGLQRGRRARLQRREVELAGGGGVSPAAERILQAPAAPVRRALQQAPARLVVAPAPARPVRRQPAPRPIHRVEPAREAAPRCRAPDAVGVGSARGAAEVGGAGLPQRGVGHARGGVGAGKQPGVAAPAGAVTAAAAVVP